MTSDEDTYEEVAELSEMVDEDVLLEEEDEVSDVVVLLLLLLLEEEEEELVCSSQRGQWQSTPNKHT